MTRADFSDEISFDSALDEVSFSRGEAIRNVIPRRSASSRARGVMMVSSVTATSPSCGMCSKSAAVIRGFMEFVGQPLLAVRRNLRKASEDSQEWPSYKRLRWRQGKDAHVLEIAIALGVVQAVSDDEFIGNLEADIIRFDVFLDAPFRLIQQRRDFQRIRFALLQNAQEVAEREPRIQNILDHKDVQALDASVQVLVEAHLPGSLATMPVTGNGHEIERHFDADLADQVGHKYRRAFQDADQ